MAAHYKKNLISSKTCYFFIHECFIIILLNDDIDTELFSCLTVEPVPHSIEYIKLGGMPAGPCWPACIEIFKRCGSRRRSKLSYIMYCKLTASYKWNLLFINNLTFKIWVKYLNLKLHIGYSGALHSAKPHGGIMMPISVFGFVI